MHRGRHRTRAAVPAGLRLAWRDGDRARQFTGGCPDLADDPAHAPEDRLSLLGGGERPLARCWCHPFHQLGRQAVLDGIAGLDIYPQCVRRLVAHGSIGQLYRRPHYSGGGTVHGNGFCVEQSQQRASRFYALAGRIERHHHGVCLCTDCCPVARHLVYPRAVGDAVPVRGSLHRAAGHRGKSLAPLFDEFG